MVYISERSNNERKSEITNVVVFTNFADAELWVNVKNIGKQKADGYGSATWENVKLEKGKNKIEVRAGAKKNIVTDSVIWNLN